MGARVLPFLRSDDAACRNQSPALRAPRSSPRLQALQADEVGSCESEVERIARILHDAAGPGFVTVHLALKELERELAPDAKRKLATVRERLGDLEAQLRDLSHELRPPMLGELGLLESLRLLAKGISERSGLEIEVQARLRGRLPASVELVLYRVVSEALCNAERHARARRVRVRVERRGGGVECSIADDGIGMDASRSTCRTAGTCGLGLLGIRERLTSVGGALHIRSEPGIGTELRARVPLEV
jgi:two-component system sensor histidine kinase UhpB